MKGVLPLKSKGYTNSQCKKFMARVWHSWLPRKVASMHWLFLAGGLPIGAWRSQAGWDGQCRVCNDAAVETAEHAFMKCPILQPAWTYLNNLRAEAHLSTIHGNISYMDPSLN